LADRELTLSVSDEATHLLAKAGFDPVYGARPLKRVIQRELQNPLATMILEGRIADGSPVEVGVEEGELTINGSHVRPGSTDAVQPGALTVH